MWLNDVVVVVVLPPNTEVYVQSSFKLKRVVSRQESRTEGPLHMHADKYEHADPAYLHIL